MDVPVGRAVTTAPGSSPPCRTVASSTSARRGPAARWSSARARSARRSPSCSPVAGCARRCRRARPSRPSGCTPTARTGPTCRASSCRASCASRRSAPGWRAPTLSSSASPRGACRGHRRAGGGRPPPRAASCRWPRASCPPRHAPTVMLAGRPAPRAWPASAARPTRERWSTRAPALVAASAAEELAPRSQRLHRAPASSASPPTTRSAWSSRAPPRTPRPWPRARPSAGPQRRGRRRRPHLRRGLALRRGAAARPESLIGLAGTGDLVATALAPQSRNRRAGELLADGVAGRRDPGDHRPGRRGARGGPLLAGALERAGIDAPVTTGCPADLRRAAARRLGRAGAHDGPAAGALAGAPGFWRRAWARVRAVFGGRRRRRPPEAGLLDPPPAASPGATG